MKNLAWVVLFTLDLVVSALWTLLTSGELLHFFLAMIFLPILAGVLLSLLYMKREVRRYRSIAVGLLVYVVLPIIINGLSLIGAQLGSVGAAHTLFTWRYASMVAIPGIALLVLFLYGWAYGMADALDVVFRCDRCEQ